MSSENVVPPRVESCVGCTFGKKKCHQINCPFYQTFQLEGPEFHRIKNLFNMDKVSDKLASIKHSSPDVAKANLDLYTECLKFHADARHEDKLEGTVALQRVARADYRRRVDARMYQVSQKKLELRRVAEGVVVLEMMYENLLRKQSGLDTIEEDVDADAETAAEKFADEFLFDSLLL